MDRPIGQADPTQPPGWFGETAPRPMRHLLLPLLVPVKAIRSYWRAMPLGWAYLVFLYGLSIGALWLALDDLLFQHFYDPYYYYGYTPTSTIVSALAGDVDAIDQILLSAVWYTILAHLCYLIAALVTMCWGAGPEPWGKSYRRSLTRWFQLTPWHAMVTGLLFLLIELIEYLDNAMAWFSGYYMVVGLIVGGMFLGFTLLGIWTTLRGLAAHDRVGGWPASCPWPLTCEGCGYALAGQTMDQGCPECGQPVAESVTARVGRSPARCAVCDYRMQDEQGRIHSPCAECGSTSLIIPSKLSELKPMRALLMGVARPRQVGQMMAAHRPDEGKGRAIARSVGLIVLTAPLGSLLALLALLAFNEASLADLDSETLVIILSTSLMGAAFGTAAMVGFGLLIGTVVGSGFALFAKRRAMHLAGQAVAYTSGFYTPWMLANWFMLAVMVSTLQFMFSGYAPPWVRLVPLIWFVVNLGCTIAYIVMVSRVIGGTRWANA